MTVSYVIEFAVRAGQRDRFLDMLQAVLSDMSHETSHRSAVLNVSPDDPLRFMLYETWADHQDVLDVQLGRRYRADWHAALPDLLTEDRRISIWRPVG